MNEAVDERVYQDSELEIFFSYLKLEELFGIDLAYMGESKIPNIDKYAIEHFNDVLMTCKIEKGIALVSLLSKISDIYMSPSKVKAYISDEIKWELIDESRGLYKSINQAYPDSDNIFKE